MLKRIFIFCLVFLSGLSNVSALDANSISADCAVLINADNNEIIFSKNHLKRRSMASTTKIMTSLIALESGKLHSEITVTEDMLRVEGTSMGLKGGDSVSLLELVYGMMLSSGNDSANATAIFLGGNLEAFAEKMNEYAYNIGMTGTNFVTPSGLDNEMHYSTAYDMALLGAKAIKNPLFLSICSDNKETLTFGNPPYERTLYNHNKLLNNYEFALGIKTGFTKKSGRCLVSYAQDNSKRLVAVTLNAPDDWNDHIKMLDYGFGELDCYSLTAPIPDSIPVTGRSGTVKLKTEAFEIASSEPVNITSKIYIEKFLYSPLKADTVVGFCNYYVNGDLSGTKPILIATDS